MGLWQQAGKPDFARCAEIISRFDPQLRESLSRSEGKVLQWLLFYAWRGNVQSGRTLAYASFSQSRMGSSFGRSRWTVARALAQLDALGLVRSLRRRPDKDGQWQTNLYFLSDKLKAILARILNKGVKTLPSAKMLHKNAEHTTKAGGLPFQRSAASQDKDKNDGNDGPSAKLRALFGRCGLVLSPS